MKLTNEDVERFRQAYQKEWKEEISEGEARVMATRLLHFYAEMEKAISKSPGVLEKIKASRKLKQPSLL